jgi:hypothetical protein
MTQYADVWKPEASIHDHSGQPIPPEASFFAPPPPEIGMVLSAHSNRMHGRKEHSMVRKILFAVAYGVGMCLLFLLIGPSCGCIIRITSLSCWSSPLSSEPVSAF